MTTLMPSLGAVRALLASTENDGTNESANLMEITGDARLWELMLANSVISRLPVLTTTVTWILLPAVERAV